MDEKNLVIKSNKLNQARYHLTIQEQRLILSLISGIRPDDDNFRVHRLSVQDFKRLVGLSGESTYSHLKNITKQLLSKVLIINEPDGDLQTHWVDHVKYYDDEGFLEVSFSEKLKPYLIALKKEFTRYQLKNVIRLKSGYSVRIYELLKQYQAVGTRYFDLLELRHILSIPDDKLVRYYDFKRRVLITAQKELTNTDIGFKFFQKKSGRSVVGITFVIIPNSDVIKTSKKGSKKKVSKNKPVERQLDLDLKRADEQKSLSLKNDLLEKLRVTYPKEFADLRKKAKRYLSDLEKLAVDKKRPGAELTLRFKMQDLLEAFLKRKGIFL